MKQIGMRVKIVGGGMKEFVGQTGVIIGDSERDGAAILYRVKLDSAIDVPNVGQVVDDLWQGCHLRVARRRRS